MKINTILRGFLLSVVALSSGALLAYANVGVRNTTPFTIDVEVDYGSLFCSKDNLNGIQPGEEAYASSRGACLVKRINAKIYIPADTKGTGKYGSSTITARTVMAEPYLSSGTSYSEFIVRMQAAYDDQGRIDWNNTTFIVDRPIS